MLRNKWYERYTTAHFEPNHETAAGRIDREMRTRPPHRNAWKTGRTMALLGCLVAAGGALSQELEPRAYAPAPVGTNFAGIGYGYQAGEVLFDPAVPVTDVRAYIHFATVGFGRTFNLGGRFASVGIGVPYVWASVGGNVAENYTEITRSGLGDTRLRFVVNLLGAPALPPRAWLARTPAPTLGLALVVNAPTGQYSSGKLVNIGTNRWAFKSEVGLSVPTGRWTLEASAGVWLFTNNTAMYPGTVVRSQDPLFTFQGHVGYTILPGLWVAVNGTYYAGGKTYANDVPGDTRQANSRVGATFSVPVARGHTIKVSASTGVDARVGSSFDSYGLAYQIAWFDRKPPAAAASQSAR